VQPIPSGGRTSTGHICAGLERPLWYRAPGRRARPVSESGRSRRGGGHQARGNRRWRVPSVGYPHEATIDDAELSRPVWDKPICSGTLKTHPIKSLEGG